MLRKKKEVISQDRPNYYSLPLGAINPKGYLKNEMDVFVKNHIGHINTTWKALENNYILGGKNYPIHEVFEYIEGLVMLAYELDNENLKAKVKPWIEGIIKSQRLNGDFLKEGDNDWLNKIYALGVLTAYYDSTLDKRVLDFVYKFCKYQFNKIDSLPPTCITMASLTVEFTILNYFYEETDKEFYLELKQKLQRFSYTFSEYFDKLMFQNETKTYLSKSTIMFKNNFIKKQKILDDLSKADSTMKDNRDQGLKKYLLSRGSVVALNLPCLLEEVKYTNNEEFDRSKKFVEELYKNHGLVNGCFSADNHLDGRELQASTDIETAVSTLRSMLEMEKLSTDIYYSSFADDIFYNVLPSMFIDEYSLVQQIGAPNQVGLENVNYYTANKKDNNYSNILSDNSIVFSSRIYNHFVQSLCYETDNGLAFHHYAPCSIKADINGNLVEILEETEYPFKDTVKLDIKSISKPEELVLRFVVPKYTSCTVSVNNREVSSSGAGIIQIKKVFETNDFITIKFNNGLRAVFNDDGTLSFRMGGLILVNALNSTIEKGKKGIKINQGENFRKAPVITDNKLEIKSIKKKDEIKNVFEFNNPMVEVKIVSDIVTNWSNNATEYSKIPKTSKFGNSVDLITLTPYANSINRISQFPCKVQKTVQKK